MQILLATAVPSHQFGLTHDPAWLSLQVIGQQSILGSERGREMADLLLVTTWMAALTALNRR